MCGLVARDTLGMAVQLENQVAPASAPVEDHPLTKKVRTYHGDLKAYLDSINAQNGTEAVQNVARAAAQPVHPA